MDPQTTAPTQPTSLQPTKNPRFRMPGLWPLLCIVLVIGLAVSIFLWKPWQANIKTSDRTISVTGDATITAEPDEFIFSPSYSIKNTDKTQASSDITAKSNDIVAKLKALGMTDSKIKTNASNYSGFYNSSNSTYTLSLTITVDDKTLAQKVQDYLLTTTPTGAITPEYGFSKAKEKALEGQARDKAEQDARAKAEQSAKNLGFKVKAVKSVQDGSSQSFGGCGFGRLCPLSGSNLQSAISDKQSLTLQPGQNDLPYSVTIVYYIK